MASLAGQGIQAVTVYSDCQLPLSEPNPSPQWPLRVRFVVDPEVSGSAGMLRLAADNSCDGKIIILPANSVNPPDIGRLLEAPPGGPGRADCIPESGPVRHPVGDLCV